MSSTVSNKKRQVK